jgi:16S rRNA (cytosine967-C5)-methyltransferase
VVEAVTRRGQSADAALRSLAPDPRASPDEAAIRAISLGTLRWYLRLEPALAELLDRPEAVAPPLRALLAVAAHQVEYSRNRPEMSVHAAVDAARFLGLSRATGFVNAVLRRFVRERERLLAGVDASLAGRTAHPEWLVERICASWPSQGPQMLTANNGHPPMTLRVDLSRISRAGFLENLKERSIDAYEIQWCPSAVTLAHPVGVSELPGFAEGLVSVQDAGAQLAATLLGVTAGERVLDACAAPGGKTGHILELMGAGADVTALDTSPERIALIQENLDRLRRSAVLCVGDAREPATFWDGRPFDRILIDAPCSSTGVIRRHPDIKLLRRAADVPAFAAAQLTILQAAMTLLAEGGRVLYSTCSVLPEENEAVIAALLEAQPLAREAPLSAGAPPEAVRRGPGVQLLPGTAAGTDGFYYACLEKTTTGT